MRQSGAPPAHPKTAGKGTSGAVFRYDRRIVKGLVELTSRDREILHALTHCVRVFTLPQIARTWWKGSSQAEAAARRRARQLEGAGLVSVVPLIAHPELRLDAPLATWQPGFQAPDASELASRLARRWPQPERETVCIAATAEAAAIVGGSGGRLPRESEATHDIHLAAVYLRMRSELPTRARSWTAEAALAKGQGVKVPDAMVRDGKYDTAIEFGGVYSAAKLEAFHRYCGRKGLAYELW